MNNPLVSIIIPVYNGANYLKDAIDSALAQTYKNCEVIVVNDGSRDNGATEAIALSYGDKIRYFSKPNGGVATALNLAIKHMKGEYFSWLSHDDMYYPNKIEMQIDCLTKCGDMTRIAFSDYDLLDVDKNSKASVSLSTQYPTHQLENSIFPILHGLVHGCALLIHKSHFERAGIFDEKLITTQDYDLWFRMFRGQRLLYIPQSLIITRVHSQQGSKTLECHNPEREALHTGFVSSLAREEILTMYPTAYEFYYQMSCVFKGAKMPLSYKYAVDKFLNEPMPENTHKKIAELHNFLSELSGGKASKICIFCAGQWGLRLFYELSCRLVSVDCFCDNSSSKHGYIVDNTHCIPLAQLAEQKSNTLVIVATKSPQAILDQLKALDFPYVATKQQLDKKISEVPPIKWLCAIDNIDGVDYSSPQIASLAGRFKQTVFDACRYYENKLSEKNNCE